MSSLQRRTRLAALLVAFLLAIPLLAACTGAGSGGGIKVTEPWARASSMMAAAGAAYMKIENTGSAADALVGAASPAAKTVEVHETVAMESEMPAASDGMGMESPMPSEGTDGGMMGMRPIARLEIPAGGSVELKPGSYHIMLIGLNQELKPGDKIEITLTFEQAGEVTVSAEVRES